MYPYIQEGHILRSRVYIELSCTQYIFCTRQSYMLYIYFVYISFICVVYIFQYVLSTRQFYIYTDSQYMALLNIGVHIHGFSIYGPNQEAVYIHESYTHYLQDTSALYI